MNLGKIFLAQLKNLETSKWGSRAMRPRCVREKLEFNKCPRFSYVPDTNQQKFYLVNKRIFRDLYIKVDPNENHEFEFPYCVNS